MPDFEEEVMYRVITIRKDLDVRLKKLKEELKRVYKHIETDSDVIEFLIDFYERHKNPVKPCL
jgi:hypothetical protein